MISSVRGRVAALAPDAAVVEVGGVGLHVQCTPSTLARLQPGEEARLATTLVVREDSLTLYGFASDDERAVFELLQTASGIGPRLAQAMLAVHSPPALRRIVATEDLPALVLVPGIGRKGAQRIVLELKDRLACGGEDEAIGPPPSSAPGSRQQVIVALTGLGWSVGEAQDAVAAAAQDAVSAAGVPGASATDVAAPDADVPALLRAALRRLASR